MSKTRDKANTPLTNFESTGIDDNATSTAVTVDSSGNVLVGKTSLDSGATAGTEIQQNGKTFLTRDNALPLQITRLNSNGEIATFFKDTTKVSNIGTVSGTDCYIGSSSTADTGLRFQTNEIVPVGNAGGNRSDAIDLGKSNIRWKDFWLSGNIYLGGTTSANALDDYEEGTWTPAISFGGASVGIVYGEQTGVYVKIGRLVHIACDLRLTNKGTSTGNFLMTGLPFSSQNVGVEYHSQPYIPNISVSENCTIYNSGNTSNIYMVEFSDNGVSASFLTNTNFTNTSIIRFQLTYQAD